MNKRKGRGRFHIELTGKEAHAGADSHRKKRYAELESIPKMVTLISRQVPGYR